MKLQEAMEFSQAGEPGSTTYGAPQPPPYTKGIVNQGYPRQSNQGYPQSKIHITTMIQPVLKSKKEQKKHIQTSKPSHIVATSHHRVPTVVRTDSRVHQSRSPKEST
jgi:hypothetical protein